MELLDYQKTAVQDLITHKRWGLWAFPGSGKTCISITACKQESAHILVITLKSLKTNWQREIVMWDPDQERRTYTVMTKEEFKKAHLTLPYFDTVIIDEAHFFGSYTSGMFKSLMAYLKKHTPPRLYALTATPIMAQVWSVWTLSQVLNRVCMTWFQFKKKFFFDISMGGRSIPKQRNGIEGEITTVLKSMGTVISKRENKNLPEQIHEYEYFSLNKHQLKAIEELDEDPTTTNFMTYFTKVLQISNGTLKVSDKDYKEIPCDKLSRTLELVEESPNCIVVCRQKAELKMLHRHIPNSYIYDGDTPADERQKILDMLKEKGGTLLLQADSGVGFNAQFMSTMIFYSHSWSYVNQLQSEGRIHRIGQENTCVYIHLVTQDSVDESVIECLKRKQDFDINLYSPNKKTA
jgi:SNF2 family DNA or RNA helicase